MLILYKYFIRGSPVTSVEVEKEWSLEFLVQ